MFKYRRGFTLIELLVVISIISLLLSILMPGLNRARESSRSLVCLHQVKSWGLMFRLFEHDNNGRMPSGTHVKGQAWMNALKDYYGGASEAQKVPWRCPSTTQLTIDGTANPFGAWFRSKDDPDPYEYWPDGYDIVGSYGMNYWCYNPPMTVQFDWARRDIGNLSWRGSVYAKTPYRVPLMLDCWQPGGYPYETDVPPRQDGELNHTGSGARDNMSWFAINRHKGSSNAAFIDGSARRVSPGNMWKYRWHKDWDITKTPEQFPEWLDRLSSFE